MTHSGTKNKSRLPRLLEPMDLPAQQSTDLINAVAADVQSRDLKRVFGGLDRLWQKRDLISYTGVLFHAMVWYAARDAAGPVMRFLIRKLHQTHPKTEPREIMVHALIKTARQMHKENPGIAEYLRLAAHRLPGDARSQANLSTAADYLQPHPSVRRRPRPLPRSFAKVQEKSR